MTSSMTLSLIWLAMCRFISFTLLVISVPRVSWTMRKIGVKDHSGMQNLVCSPKFLTKSLGILDLLSQTLVRSWNDLESCSRTLGHISWAVASMAVTLVLMWSAMKIFLNKSQYWIEPGEINQFPHFTLLVKSDKGLLINDHFYPAGKTGAPWKCAAACPLWDSCRHVWGRKKCWLEQSDSTLSSPYLAVVSWREDSNSLHFSASLIRPAACCVSRVGSLNGEKRKLNIPPPPPVLYTANLYRMGLHPLR